MGIEGQSMVQKSFSIDAMVEKNIEVYQQMMANG
jgi:hypothetical protein